MNKKFKVLLTIGFAIIIVGILGIIFCGCNRQFIDTTYAYDKAIISLPNGKVVEGVVQSWRDYTDGDQLQVRIDGKTYLVHSMNCVLIAE